MKTSMVKQRTPEWLAARCGKPSASDFKKILTPGGKLSASWKKYAAELASAMFSLIPPEGCDSYMNNAVRWGAATEHSARLWYSGQQDADVLEVGGCLDDSGRFWCSPDGLVGPIFADQDSADEFYFMWRRGVTEADEPRFCELGERIIGTEGGIELYCPQGETQAEALLAEEPSVADSKLVQVHGALIVTGAKWWDFLSYSPGLRPILIRTYPNEFTAKLRAALEEFYPKFLKAISTIKGEV